MSTQKCASCGQEYEGWLEYCPHCSEPVANYARPAGFWIRVGASIIDWLVFIPIMILFFWNMFSLRNTALLILISVPGFLYKPFMEAFCGATLGKMSCGIKVVDAEGKKLSLFSAYIRAFPFLMSSGVELGRQLILFSSEQFQEATSWIEASQVRTETFLDYVGPLVNLLILIDCVLVVFTFRKQALHDMLAESYCVYKEP
ncbi:MAG: RDD family protein [Phycisphaerales bacterium]|nr:MAG: RDD family protein [Phycisphaerales bacterium]